MLMFSILNHASKRPNDKIKFPSKFYLWKTLEVKFRSHDSNKISEMFPDKLMQETEKNI